MRVSCGVFIRCMHVRLYDVTYGCKVKPLVPDPGSGSLDGRTCTSTVSVNQLVRAALQ